MKRDSGFAHFLIILLVLIVGVGIALFAFWHINYTQHNIGLESGMNSGGGLVPGEVVVVFKPETTTEQATNLISSYELTAKDPVFKYPSRTFRLKNNEDIDVVADKIRGKNLPFIKDVQVVGKDRGQIKPWILVDFILPSGVDEINKILAIDGNLYEEAVPSLDKTVVVVTPVGEEQKWVDTFNQNGLVQSSYVNMKAVLLN